MSCSIPWKALVFSGSVLSAACDRMVERTDLERMIDQSRYDAYEWSEFFEDGMAMRHPPLGTVPRERITGRPALTSGVVTGRYVERIPLPVTRELLARGRQRFEIFCAACHGLSGYALTPVAENMRLRRPPSLHDPDVRRLVVGRIYGVIEHGYGLMPSYATELDVAERWAVVAYVQALQLSQNASVDALPAEIRAEAERELP